MGEFYFSSCATTCSMVSGHPLLRRFALLIEIELKLSEAYNTTGKLCLSVIKVTLLALQNVHYI